MPGSGPKMIYLQKDNNEPALAHNACWFIALLTGPDQAWVRCTSSLT
jgi:hypothetical protein